MSSEPVAPTRKLLVLDANILVRVVLGRRVLGLLETYADRMSFLAPEVAFEEVRAHLPAILAKRGVAPDVIAASLEDALGHLPLLVLPIPHEVYADLEEEARRRLAGRDQADWPIVALALRFNAPIWTEAQDFFGSGIATWTTDRVELYLAS